MKRKFGIKKTKMNIFWLFIVGLLLGVVLGLRQPAPDTPAGTEQTGANVESHL